MYQRILVPLDGSVLSETVLPHAANLARALDVEIVLVHVEISPVPEFDPHTSLLAPQTDEIRRMREANKSYIKAMCAKLEKEGARATYLLREGPVAEQIIETAGIMQADLIAMSTHGRTGMLRLLLGSVAGKVVHESRIPVMLIRPHGAQSPGASEG
jgi:nucleotide-binding universal stress UspA family protein